MLKDITIGQYFPGNTWVHKLDPRTKLIMTVVYIAALFTAKGYISYAVVLCFLITVINISRVNLKVLFRSLKPIIIIVAFTAVLNILFTSGTPVLKFWIITITKEGLINAVLMVLRLIMLMAGTFILTYTTTPLALTDGLESLLGPLKKIRFPVHELAMMMNTALRFIPDLIDETDKIMSAQKARGANFETGNLIERAKAMMPLIVPLFISAFRRADELAIAMESRCYHGGEGRTRMKQLAAGKRDYITGCIGAGLLAVIIVLAVLGL